MPQDWGAAFREALLETDQQKMACKIESADAVPWDSLAELDSSREHLSEEQLISNALRMMRRLQLQDPGPIEPFGTAITTQVKNSG